MKSTGCISPRSRHKSPMRQLLSASSQAWRASDATLTMAIVFTLAMVLGMSSPVARAYDGDFLGACVSGGVGCDHNKYAKMRNVSVGPLFDDAAQAKIVSKQEKMADKLDECLFDAFIQSFNVEENKLKKHYIASALRCGRLAGYQSGIK